ncbi:MAG TPA: hypothetical protein VKH44_13710, partial [Pirellulaceae bacterium]|nr:hypothetical protein [Pirellulaceae bacterium]
MPPKAPLKPTAEQLAKWSISEAEPLQLLACYDGFSDNVLQALAATPDGKQFVVGGARLSLWNVGDAEPLKDLLADKKNEQVERPILAAATSPDGTLLAAGDNDGRLFAWKLSDHSEVFAIKAHEGRLTQLAFSPDSKTIATTGYNGEVRLWQTADGATIKVIK